MELMIIHERRVLFVALFIDLLPVLMRSILIIVNREGISLCIKGS